MSTTLQTSYHNVSFEHESRKDAVERVLARMSSIPEGTGIVMSGLSGILVGLQVADALKRDFAIVRKIGEDCHTSSKVEGYLIQNYVIVDDFIVSGDTIRYIVDMMSSKNPDSRCLGIVLYNDTRNPCGSNVNDIPVVLA